ncbi:ATP-binding protein [Streptomyces sp. NPDC050504]|uniref:ATP-binding protein n=1 Tax=Streptomyces sp. NPDC050504 TaxID=3365618 RepID=UPI00378B52C1
MVRVDSPPTDRETPFVRALLLLFLLMAAATAAAVAAVDEVARIPVLWCGAVMTVVVAGLLTALLRRGRTLRGLRAEHQQRTTVLEHRLARHDAEALRFATELLPTAISRMRQGEAPHETMIAVVDSDEQFRTIGEGQRRMLRKVLEVIDDEEAMRESAQRSFVSIARRVQAIVHQQASELRMMEEDHGHNPEVFDDLLRIDHGNALIGRLADSISVLGGARPSRQWPKPVPLYSVLRGSMSRILEYRRVDLHAIAQVAIVGTAVEPLIHACAELLDNATRYSPPQTRVHVTAVEVQTGVAIEIEDGGVSLSEEARRRAENMLAAAQAGVDLNALGDTPRLGMAVVGRLSKMYDLQVSLRQSAYGGVRAVLIVPRDMITTGRAPGIAHGIGAASRPSRDADDNPLPEPARAKAWREKKARGGGPKRPVPTTASAMEEDVPVVTEWTANGLPQRRSRMRAPLGSHNVPAPAPEAPARELNGHAADSPFGGDAYGDDPFAAEPAEPSARTGVYADEQPYGAEPKQEPGPGIWLEAFTKAVNGVPEGPAADGDSDDAWDKGDLK